LALAEENTLSDDPSTAMAPFHASSPGASLGMVVVSALPSPTAVAGAGTETSFRKIVPDR
jgi:hypothetical protein